MRTPIFLLLLGSIASYAQAPSPKELAQWKKTYVRPKTTPFPPQNPYSKQKAELGRALFFDPRLSGNNHMSCATCHDPKKAFSDNLPLAIGDGGRTLTRKTPSIVNPAWGKGFFWDGRALTLEEQAKGPIITPEEMNQSLTELGTELAAVPRYQAWFNAAFPGIGISPETITQAIATFERTLVSAQAPFDRWVAGKEAAISESAKRGFILFNSKARCSVCHDRWNFTDGSFADTGVESEDPGMGKFDKSPFVQHFFKTPSLRNVTKRKAFFHNGSLTSLSAVIDFYNQGGKVKRTTLSPDVRPLGLTATEKADLIAFLETLTSDDLLPVAPELP